jgi:adenylate cyclase
MLTRSYVEYLTSNSILIGAEVDKILSILFVTAILALAVNGSRNLLVTAIAEQSAAADFSRFFDRSIASGIRGGAPLKAGEGERREAAILSIDVRGFTRLAEALEPSQVMRFLSAYQRRVVPIVQAHGGVIDKFMGDGILATFGTVGDSACPAADALRAAEAILEDKAKWAGEEDIADHGPVSIGMGIAAGTVSFGAVGGNGRLEMTVIGPAVNLAAKLEKHNKAVASHCLVDARTWKLARDQGYEGRLRARTLDTPVEGTGKTMKVAALSLPGARRAAKTA